MTPLLCYRYYFMGKWDFLVIDQAGRPWDAVHGTCTGDQEMVFYSMSGARRGSGWYATTRRGALRCVYYRTKKHARLVAGGIIRDAIQRNAWRFVSPIGQTVDESGCAHVTIPRKQ